MRTRTQRLDARREIMKGVNDHDTTMVEAILELCDTLDDLGERFADAHDETRKAIDGLADQFGKLKALLP
jgi:hypothetical protein